MYKKYKAYNFNETLFETKLFSIDHEILKNQESIRDSSVNEQDFRPDF